MTPSDHDVVMEPVSTQSVKQRLLEHSPIFDRVYYWLNPFMSETLCQELREALNQHGAVESSTLSDDAMDEEENQLFRSRFSLKLTTHCITWDMDFPECEEAQARQIHIVTPTWVKRALRNGYAHKPEFYSPSPDRFLSGIVVTTANLSDADRDAIFAGVEAFGGQWREKMVREVTHLVTTTASGPRYESAMQHVELGIKVVLPHWLDDCFRLKRRVPEHRYLFPDPIVLYENPWVTTQGLPSIDVSIDMSKYAGEERYQIEEKDPHVLRGYTIYLADDLRLTDEAKVSIRRRVQTVGGQLCDTYDPDQVHIVICRWRTSEAYRQAVTDKKMVGTLSWLYHLLLTGRRESSSLQLLHYPVPKHGIPEMRRMVITITNYYGMAREYLKRLIALCGAEYTGDLSQRNTHLICGSPFGKKYEYAMAWNIITVNHLWLEESYRAWKCQAPTKPHYVHFPSGEGLSEIVGQTSYRIEDLRPWIEQAMGANATATNAQISVEASDHEEEKATAAGQMNTENQTSGPLSTYRQRRSALDANARLASLVESMNEFEREMRYAHRQRMLQKRQRQQDIHSGGEMSTREAKRHASDAQVSEKRVKASSSSTADATVNSGSSVAILTTGTKLTQAHIQGLQRIGGRLAESIDDCTHLIAKRAARTEKFLSALATAKYIMPLEWLTCSIEQGHFLSESQYPFCDPQSEEMYGYQLAVSWKRAKEKRVYEDRLFVLTAHIQSDLATLVRVIQIAGGKVKRFDGEVTGEYALTLEEIPQLPSNTIVISSKEDESLWRLFTNRDGAPSLPVYTSEFVLIGILRQTTDDLEEHRLA